MSVNLSDVIVAMESGRAALVGENAGYLVLLAADAALGRPLAPTPSSIELEDDGSVRLGGAPCTPAECEGALRRLLGRLLAPLKTRAQNLERVAERAESRGLETLVLELEAALVPVNRRAAKRSLARLVRETERAKRAHAADFAVVERPAARAPSAAQVDAPVVSSPLEIDVHVEFEPAPIESGIDAHVEPRDEEPTRLYVATEVEPGPEARPLSTRPSAPPHLLDALAGSFLESPEPPPPALVERVVAEAFVASESVAPEFAAPELAAPESDASEFVEPTFLPAPNESEWVEEEDLLTEIFAGTTSESAEPEAVTTVPAPAAARPAKVRRTRFLVPMAPESVEIEAGPLVEMAEKETRRPSDLGELLDRMNPKGAPREVFGELKRLSRVDLSPEAPPVVER